MGGYFESLVGTCFLVLRWWERIVGGFGCLGVVYYLYYGAMFDGKTW